MTTATIQLTKEQRMKIHHLERTKHALNTAREEIEKALSGSDVGQWYTNDITAMIAEIDEDVMSIWEE
jgi:predicted  nucleic acid-binding Zn-ribbon protein